MNMAQALEQSGVIASMAHELGVDEQTARQGAAALLPAIVGGLGRSHAAGAAGGLGDVLAGLADGGGAGAQAGLGGIGGVLLDQVLGRSATPTKPGNDILGQIFGNKDVSRGVAEEVAGSTGLSFDLLKKMLPILAVAVVGYMLKQGGSSSVGQAGSGPVGGALGGMLGQVVTGMLRR